MATGTSDGSSARALETTTSIDLNGNGPGRPLTSTWERAFHELT